MSLVNPAALLFAALALPVVVFYILKIRLRRVPVSTLMFWRQIFEEKKPRSIWQRLRHLLSLLLQLAFLTLLVLALADPIFRWQQARSRRPGPRRGQLGQHERERRVAEPPGGGEGPGRRSSTASDWATSWPSSPPARSPRSTAG
ncbi:MAG: BatA domain-containing protein [Singulisphaera sp.]